MKMNNRVLQAVVQRHNDQISQRESVIDAEIQKQARSEVVSLLAEANQLLLAFHEARKKAHALGFDFSVDGYHQDSKPMTVDASLEFKELVRRRKTWPEKAGKRITPDEILLRMTAMGEDDFAKALDKLGLNWRIK